MNVDRYTKCVLTVIAGCLVWICVMGTALPLSAQGGGSRIFQNADVRPVVVVGTGTLDQAGAVTVHFSHQESGKWVTDPMLPVSLPYSATRPLPVSLPYNAANPIPAHLTYTQAAPLPIEINGVKRFGEWEPLRTAVEPAPTRRNPGGGSQ